MPASFLMRWGRARHRPLLALVALLSGLWFLGTQDWGDLETALAGARVEWVLAAVAAYAAGHTLRAQRWVILLSPLAACPRRTATHALTVGAMGNNILPAKAGSLARVHLVAERLGVPRAAVGGSLAAEALLDALILLGLAVVVLAAAQPPAALQGATIVLATGVAGVLTTAAILIRGRDSRIARRLAGRLPGACAPLAAATTGFGLGARGLTSRRHAGLATLVSLLAWGGTLLAYFCLGQALRLPLSPMDYAVAVGVGQIALSTPVAAGAGTFELTTTQTLVALGGAHGAVGAYALALHALLVVPVTLAGLVLILGARVLAARRRRRMQAPTATGAVEPRRSLLPAVASIATLVPQAPVAERQAA